MQDLSKMSDLHLLYKYETIIKENGSMTNLPAGLFVDPRPYFNEVLRRLSLAPKWRPISEAPKDGTKIIAISYGNVYHINVIWWWDDAWEDGTCQGPSEPSHFIFLPSPPESKDD